MDTAVLTSNGSAPATSSGPAAVAPTRPATVTPVNTVRSVTRRHRRITASTAGMWPRWPPTR
jgi:hypothetical protein